MELICDTRKQGVSPIRSGGSTQQSCGIGYVIIPPGSDREEFVMMCFRQNLITIIDDVSGSIMYNCYVTKEVLDNISFPRMEGAKGSPVVWVAQPYNNKPIVVGTFVSSDKPSVRGDESIEIHKSWDTGCIDISGNPADGTFTVAITGEPFASMSIKALGNENSLIDVQSAGDIVINAAKGVKVVSYDNMEAQVKDVDNDNSSGVVVNKEETVFSNTFGEGDDKKSVKTTINENGLVTEFTIGDNDYKQVIDDSKCETTLGDCTVTIQNGKIMLKQGDAVVELTEGKLGLINQVATLKGLLQETLDMVKNLTVATAYGPSGTPLPPTILAITAIEQKLNGFFSR